MYAFQNLTVSASAIDFGANVTITYPGHARGLVTRYLDLLPALPEAPSEGDLPSEDEPSSGGPGASEDAT